MRAVEYRGAVGYVEYVGVVEYVRAAERAGPVVAAILGYGGVVPDGWARRKPSCSVIIYREVILQNSGRRSLAVKVPV